MHVVWARGQVEGNIHHVPNSGLDSAGSNPSIPNFYYKDELKYHGRDTGGSNYGHRGFLTVNFFSMHINLIIIVKSTIIDVFLFLFLFIFYNYYFIISPFLYSYSYY